jgi:hyperosmotically inducible protein
MQGIKSARARMRPFTIVTAALLTTTLLACGKSGDSQTTGEKADAAMAKTQQMAGDAKEGVKSTASDAAQVTEQAAADVGDKVRDAAITSAVSAKLMREKTLSVAHISVDTVNGRVVLKGTAPDANTRERAQTLASTVDGVVTVDNQIVVSNS